MLSGKTLKCCGILIALFLPVFGAQSLNLSGSDSSTGRNVSFNFLLSANAVINQGLDPQKTGLFYSSVPYELQFRYKRHHFGISYLRNLKSDQSYVNGIKMVNDVIRYRFHVSYSREMLSDKNWSCQLGSAYYFQKRDTANIMYTSLENPYKNWVETENGFGAFARLGYKFNKFIAIYLETQVYVGHSKYNYEYNYPLTPSQNMKGSSERIRYHMLLPSNLFLRISID